MKVLYINCEHYFYPEGVSTLDEFVERLEKSQNKFIKLKKLCEANCIRPYFVLEEIKEVYLSIASIDEIVESEVVVMEEKEYLKMLENVKKKRCSLCDEREDCFKNEKGLREKLCLDGSCDEYCEE